MDVILGKHKVLRSDAEQRLADERCCHRDTGYSPQAPVLEYLFPRLRHWFRGGEILGREASMVY